MTEQQFEMMDNYLLDRLSADDKTAFEQQIQADPQLAQELAIQKNLVEGLRQARVAELKNILNHVPISPINGGGNLLMKVGTWAVVAGLVTTGIYFYITKNEPRNTVEPEVTSAQLPNENPSVTQVPVIEPEPTTEKKEESVSARINTKESVKKPDPQPVKTEPAPAKPIDVYVPPVAEADETQQTEQHIENIKKAFVTSSIEVETDTMNKKYSFHYVFKNSRLILYGAFEKNLYEILEFIGDEKRTVVLFYKSNYYLLDITKTEPTKLTPIRDRKLLKMLEGTQK